MIEIHLYAVMTGILAFFAYKMYRSKPSTETRGAEYPNHYMNTKTKKKIYQVYCNDERGVNNWFELNSDVEVVDINTCVDQDGELITVVYLIEEEEK